MLPIRRAIFPVFLLVPGLLLMLCPVAAAAKITFDNLTRGQVLTNQYTSSGVTFSAVNNGGGPNQLVIFDSNMAVPTTAQLAASGRPSANDGDSDLANPWLGGNLQGTDVKLFFVIAENNRDVWINQSGSTDGSGDGLIDIPDDEGGGGVITMKFAKDLARFRMIEADADGGQTSSILITLKDDGTQVYQTTLAAWGALDATVSFNDHYLNQLPWITSTMAGGVFDEVAITLPGSGAFDSLEFVPIPEPGTFVLLGLGLGLSGFAAGRRRRRRAA